MRTRSRKASSLFHTIGAHTCRGHPIRCHHRHAPSAPLSHAMLVCFLSSTTPSPETCTLLLSVIYSRSTSASDGNGRSRVNTCLRATLIRHFLPVYSPFLIWRFFFSLHGEFGVPNTPRHLVKPRHHILGCVLCVECVCWLCVWHKSLPFHECIINPCC